MGYAIYNLRGGSGSYGRKSSETKEFYEAMEMAKEGLERVCDLAMEMSEEYGERGGGYGRRGGYGSRSNYRGRGGSYGSRYGEREEWEDEMDGDWGERRRRDSRGRYM